MDGRLEELLNHIGAGTFIAILISLGCVCFTVYTLYQKIRSKIKTDVTEELQEIEQMTTITSSIEQLTNQLNTLQSSIDTISSKQQSMTSQLTDVENKIDLEHEESTKKDSHLESHIEHIQKSIKMINNNQKLMMESDKDSILVYITDIYYDSMKKGYISMHRMTNLQKRYDKYLAFNGNAFAEAMMKDIRSLPHNPPESQDIEE